MALFRYLFVAFFITLSLFADDSTLEKVSVQFKWKHQFQFAGFYIAKEKGFYENVGLDVAFYEYEPSVDIVGSVLRQERNFGVGYSSIVYERIKGKEITLLSALLQSSPYVLATLKSSKIHSIKDFKNKKIMIAKEAMHTTAFVSMLYSHGLSFDDLEHYNPDNDVEKLLNKEVDIISGFTSNQIHILKKRGAEIEVWDPKDFGFDFYDDILFTSNEELKKHPHRSKNFLLATLRGYKYAYEHPEEAIALIEKKYNTQNKSHEALVFEAQALKALAFDKEGAFGTITAPKIQRLLDIYNLFGQVDTKIEPESFLYELEQRLNLNDEERSYLAKKKVIKMCIDPHWMPFEAIIDSKYVGMSADYYKLFEQKLPVHFEPISAQNWSESYEKAKRRECDILSLAMATPEREKHFVFTDSYLNIPMVMATKIDAPFVSDISALYGKKIGIASGYAFLEILRRDYPNLEIVEVKTLNDGLNRVVQGDLYGYIGTLATIGYSFQQNYTGELKISGKFDGSWDLGIGVRSDDPILYSILQKVLRSIERSEKQKILNNWLSIRYEQKSDYKLLFKITAALLALIGLMVVFYLRERGLKKSVIMNQNLLQAMINNIPNPIFYKDNRGVYRYVNDAFSKEIIGVDKADLIGKSLTDLEGILDQEKISYHEEYNQLLYTNRETVEYEDTIKLHNGSERVYQIIKKVFSSSEGEYLGFICIMSDITEHKAKEKELQELASVDPLTQLFNRRYFSKMAKQLLSSAKRYESALSIMTLDLDNFKNINDTYGHSFGDQVLMLLAKTLQEQSRESDIIARFGGEEFVLMLPKTDIKGAFTLAEKIRKSVQELRIEADNGVEVNFTISLGVSEFIVGDENENVEEVLKRADRALYSSKRSGKNRVSIA